MRDTDTIWKQTIAGVASGLILLFLVWIGGFLPSIWLWLVTAAAHAWRILNFSVSLPIWSVLAFAAVVYMFRRRLLPRTRNESAAPTTSLSADESGPSLSALETAVVQVLTRVDGAWLTLDELASRLNLSRLVVEQAVERLFAVGFLLDNHNILHGTSFRLSSDGRDYAIAHGFVSSAPYAA